MTSGSAGPDPEVAVLDQAPIRPLVVAVCQECGAVRHPVPDRCPACGGMVERRGAETGRMVSWTLVHHPPPGFTAPYTMAWVEIDDVGIGVMGRVVSSSRVPLQFGAGVSVQEEQVPDQPSLVWVVLDDE